MHTFWTTLLPFISVDQISGLRPRVVRLLSSKQCQALRSTDRLSSLGMEAPHTRAALCALQMGI